MTNDFSGQITKCSVIFSPISREKSQLDFGFIRKTETKAEISSNLRNILVKKLFIFKDGGMSKSLGGQIVIACLFLLLFSLMAKIEAMILFFFLLKKFID